MSFKSYCEGKGGGGSGLELPSSSQCGIATCSVQVYAVVGVMS